MANLEVTQLNYAERASYSEASLARSLPRSGRRALAALTVLFIGVLAVLTYAALETFAGWHQLVFLADVLLCYACVAMWINPRRKRIY